MPAERAAALVDAQGRLPGAGIFADGRLLLVYGDPEQIQAMLADLNAGDAVEVVAIDVEPPAPATAHPWGSPVYPHDRHGLTVPLNEPAPAPPARVNRRAHRRGRGR